MVDPLGAVASLGVFIFSTVCHEAAHAWTALRLGDDTAHRGGQVSLDPLPHIRREPFGMVVMPLLSLLMGGYVMGWASAPYDPEWARQYPRRAAWMAMAGPAANLALMLAAVVLLEIGLFSGVFLPPQSISAGHVVDVAGGGLAGAAGLLLSELFTMNLLLFLFNMIPVPPLDGSALPGLLPGEAGVRAMRAMDQPMLRMMGLLLMWKGFGYVFTPVFFAAAALLHPGITYR